MLTSDIEPVSNRKRVGIYWAFGGLGVILFLMILYSLELGSQVAGQQAVLVDAVKEMRYETTHANLLLERSRSRKHDSTTSDLAVSRERSNNLCRVILEGGLYGGVHVEVIQDGELQGRLQNVIELQNDFYDILEDFQSRLQVDGHISKDNPYSVMTASKHETLNAALDGVEKRLKAVIGRKHGVFRITQIGLLILFLVCAVGAGWMMWAFVDKLESQNLRVRESEARTRLLFENAKDMIFLVDLVTGEVMDANAEACDLLGYERRELLGKAIGEVEAKGELRQFEKSSSILSPQKSFRVETDFLTKSGNTLPVEVSLGYVEIRNRTCWLGVVRDFSERKKMEAELIKAKHQAEVVNRIKSEFLNNMNHEIRTPINGVMGVLQLLQTTSLSDEQREYVDMGLQSCTLLTSLIGNILELSEMDTKSVALQKQPFFLMETIAAVGADYAEIIARKGLHFRVSYDDRIPEALEGDPNRIKQIITSLVDNAVKFTEAGEVDLRVSMISQDPSEENEKITLKLEVMDSGPGLSSEKLDSIFEPFEQGDSSSTRRFQGAGIGLSVVRKLVFQMEGKVYAACRKSGGSRFVVELPLNRCFPIEAQEHTVSLVEQGESGNKAGINGEPQFESRRPDNLSEILGKLSIRTKHRSADQVIKSVSVRKKVQWMD